MGRLVMQREAIVMKWVSQGIWSLARKGCELSVSGLLQQPAQFAFSSVSLLAVLTVDTELYKCKGTVQVF